MLRAYPRVSNAYSQSWIFGKIEKNRSPTTPYFYSHNPSALEKINPIMWNYTCMNQSTNLEVKGGEEEKD